MDFINITVEQLLQFGKQVGNERSARIIRMIGENSPALLKAFAAKNGLPVDTEACPTDAFPPDTLRTAEAAVTLNVIQALQKHLRKLNVPNFPTDDHDHDHDHDHGHGGCKCGGHCNCGGHGGCNCGGDGPGHDTSK